MPEILARRRTGALPPGASEISPKLLFSRGGCVHAIQRATTGQEYLRTGALAELAQCSLRSLRATAIHALEPLSAKSPAAIGA